MSKAMQSQVKAPTIAKSSSATAQSGLLQNHSAYQTEPATRAPVAPCLGHNFSQVQVHAALPETIQTKMTVNQPGDKYEQEADQVAEQLMRLPMPDSPSFEAQSREDKERLHKRPMEDIEENLQTKRSPGQTPNVTPELQTSISNMKGEGQPLSESVRAFMEPRFRHDFSRIRIHTDAQAADTAQALNARAYTVGQDIVFGHGAYAPGTAIGKNLLAHELTHTIQQGFTHRSVQSSPLSLSNSSEDSKQKIKGSLHSSFIHNREEMFRPSLTRSGGVIQRQDAGETTETHAFPKERFAPVRQAFEENAVKTTAQESCIKILQTGFRKLFAKQLKGKYLDPTSIETTMTNMSTLHLTGEPIRNEFLSAKGQITKGTLAPVKLQNSVKAAVLGKV